MNIDYQYLRPEKAKALKKWYDDPIEVRETPAIWQGSNATILPLRRGFGLLFGKGGVVDETGNMFPCPPFPDGWRATIPWNTRNTGTRRWSTAAIS